MREQLPAEDILELSERAGHRVTDHIADAFTLPGSKALAAAIVVLLVAASWLAAERSERTPVLAPGLPAGRPAAPAPLPERRPMTLGHELTGTGPFLIVAERTGGIRIVAVDLGARGRDPIFLGEVQGELLAGVDQGQARGGPVPVVAFEGGGEWSLTNVWLVRRDRRLERPVYQTRLRVEGFSFRPDGKAAAVTLAERAAQSAPVLWLVPFDGSEPARVRRMHRPGSLDPTQTIVPVGWLGDEVLAFSACAPCPGVFSIAITGGVRWLPWLRDQHPFEGQFTADASAVVMHSVRVSCPGGGCRTEHLLLRTDAGRDAVETLAASRGHDFDDLTLSPLGTVVAYASRARPDEVRWRDLPAGSTRSFRRPGVRLTPALWLDEERLLVVAAGAARTVLLLVRRHQPERAQALWSGGDVGVLGWIR